MSDQLPPEALAAEFDPDGVPEQTPNASLDPDGPEGHIEGEGDEPLPDGTVTVDRSMARAADLRRRR